MNGRLAEIALLLGLPPLKSRVEFMVQRTIFSSEVLLSQTTANLTPPVDRATRLVDHRFSPPGFQEGLASGSSLPGPSPQMWYVVFFGIPEGFFFFLSVVTKILKSCKIWIVCIA